MSSPKLLVSNLSHLYSDRKSGRKLLALHNVSLEVHKGEFVAVVGPSGCGKTTLLNISAGLVRPTQGKVMVDDAPVNEPTSRTAIVFQHPLLLPWKNLLRNVSWGLELSGVSRSDAVMKATEAIRMVGLSGFEEYLPNNLSGGMQQRANLARALVMDPELLLMDEPFANLDAQTREILQHELVKIWETTRKTILFVTHNISEAIYLADRIFVLTKRPGRVKDIVHVNLPRPRTLDMKRTPQFLEYDARIWNTLEIGLT
ncbi:ABC transporter ATP-binding protein [[Eubacterium] cellulosolvens]